MCIAQDSAYFNKLIFPYINATNPIMSVVKQDSGYSLSMLSYDTIQKLCAIDIDNNGLIVKKNCWSLNSTTSIYQYPGNSFIKSNDSNYIFASVRMDTSGVIQGLLNKVSSETLDTIWTRTYTHPDTAAALQPGADIFNAFTAIRQTLDGGFIITGMYNPNCNTNGDRRAYLLKIDSVGDVQWIKKYPQIGSLYDIELAPDSGFYFPAVLNLYTPRVYKINKQGITEWYLDVNSNIKAGYPMDLKILDSNYLYVTSKYLYDLVYLKSGITLTKINITTHTEEWEKNYILFNTFECFSLHQSMGLDILPSGDLIITGTSHMVNPDNPNELGYKGVIMKVNSNGDSLWARWHGHGLFADDCQINDIVLTDDGGFLATGWQWHNNGGLFFQNAWLLKMDSMGCDTAGCHIYDGFDREVNYKIEFRVFPNPTDDILNIEFDKVYNHEIKIKIYNSIGQLVLEKSSEKGVTLQRINIKAISRGIYFIEIVDKNGILTSDKFIIE